MAAAAAALVWLQSGFSVYYCVSYPIAGSPTAGVSPAITPRFGKAFGPLYGVRYDTILPLPFLQQAVICRRFAYRLQAWVLLLAQTLLS